MALDLNRELCLSGWLEGPGECMTAKEVKSSSVQVTFTSISHPSFVSHRGLLIQIIVLPLSPLLSLAAVIQTNGLSVSLLDSTSLFVPTRLARIRPDPNRHLTWDDLGLGIRRSGVLPSHSRVNGVPPLYREWVAFSTGARFPS